MRLLQQLLGGRLLPPRVGAQRGELALQRRKLLRRLAQRVGAALPLVVRQRPGLRRGRAARECAGHGGRAEGAVGGACGVAARVGGVHRRRGLRRAAGAATRGQAQASPTRAA